MPNYADYRLIVGGLKNNIDKLVNILQEDDYNKIHMYRIFEAIPSTDPISKYGYYIKAEITGYAAWSASVCMLPGPLTYYTDDLNRHKNNEIVQRFNQDTRKFEDYQCNMDNFSGTNLVELANKLNLTIYLYEHEPGCCFCYEAKITPYNGIIYDREGSYNEYWLEENMHSDNTYDSFKEYCDYWDYDPDDLPFDEEEYNFMMEDGIPSYENAEFDCNEDAIPDKPKYLAKNIMYKLVNKNNKGD